MTYISLEMKRKLKNVGFCFPDYEDFLNSGMIFSYQDDEYIIGGFCNADFSPTDKEIAQKGEWLPDCHQLLQWLQQCHFDISISWDMQESRFYLSAIYLDGSKYEAKSVDLADGLANIIYRICRTNNGECAPDRLFRLKICSEGKKLG